MRTPRNVSGGYTTSDLLNHFAAASVTPALCVKVTPQVGSAIAFTTASSDISGLSGHVGITFKSTVGVAEASQLETAAGAHASNLELKILLASAGITEAELNTPKWQGAEVDAFLLNYEAPAMGELVLPVTGGRLADIRIQVPLAFTAEARGINNALQQQIGRQTSPLSDTELGDERCGLDIVALGFVKTGKAVTTVTSVTVFRVASVAGLGVDYFTNGLMEVETGSNAGFPAIRIKSFDNSNGEIVLQRPVAYALTTSDTVKLTRGCRKRFLEDCVGTFNNGVNFRGMPYVPLEAAMRVVEG
jgi:uncharacterized phage protein (TIGR02218 family)